MTIIKKEEIRGYLEYLNQQDIRFNELVKKQGSKAVLDSFYDNLFMFRRIEKVKKIQNKIKNNF